MTKKREAVSASMRPKLMRPENGVTKCVNLRRDPMDGSLVGASIPGVWVADTSWQPFASGTLANGVTAVLLKKDASIAVMTDDVITALGQLPSSPECALFLHDRIVVMTASHGPATVRFHEDTETFSLTGAGTSSADITLRVVEASRVVAYLPTVYLPTPLSRWEAIEVKTQKQYASLLLDGYERMMEEARGARRFCQPVFARVKYFDSMGRLLRTSPVSVLASSSGWGGAEGFTASAVQGSDGKYTMISEMTMSLKCWQIAIDVPGETAASSDVAYAEIYLSPQMHPVDFSAQPEYRMEGGGTAGASIRLWLPGATSGNSLRSSYFSSRYCGAACMMDSLEQYAGRVDAPFSGKPRTIVLERSLSWQASSVSEEMAAMTKTPPQVSSAPVLSSSFSARVVCCSGSKVLWGGITEHFGSGVSMAAYAAASAEGGCRWSIRVTRRTSGGSVIRSSSSGTSPFLPESLNPMICVDDPSATLIEIRVEDTDGEMLEAYFPLVPSPDGSFVLYMNSAMKPNGWTASGSIYTPFTEGTAMQTRPGYVAVCEKDSPLIPLAEVDCGSLRIFALTPAWAANAGWDYGSARFYAFTDSGTVGVALTGTGKLRTSLIDPRPARTRGCATLTPDGVVALVGGELVRIAGTKAVTLAHSTPGKRVAYDGEHHEVWVTDSNGVTIYSPSDGSCFTRGGFRVDAMTEVAGVLLVKSGNTLRVTSASDPEPIEVEWESEIPAGYRRRFTYLLRLTSTRVEDGNVFITVPRMDGGTRVMHIQRLPGCVEAPVGARVLLPPVTPVRIGTRMHTSPSVRIGECTLIG